MKKVMTLLLGLFVALTVAGCSHESDIVSKNLSTDADYFKVPRRIVFYNGITGDYMLVIEGYCALGNDDPTDELTVICKVAGEQYKKNFLGLSDNVTYFVEQLDATNVSADHYKVVFKPSVIIPDIEVK